MKRMAVLATAVLAGGLLWAVRPANVSATTLVEGLNGPDAVNCFSELRQMEDEKTDEAIVAGTKHSSARVRGQCARLLGQRQDVTMAAILAPMVSDPDPSVRNLAARSLLPLLDDEEMVELLRSDKLPPASQIVMLAALLRDPLAITNAPLLDWALDRAHPTDVRVGCYVNLRSHHCPNFGEKKAEKEQLAEVLAARQRIIQQARADAYDGDCPEEVRCAALPLYAALSGPAVYDEVLAFLKHPLPALREASLLALASTHDARTWGLFCKLAVDSRQPLGFRLSSLHGLRYLARGLGKEKEKEAFPILCRVAEDRKEPVEVRSVALASLRPYRFEQEAMRIARAAMQAPEPLLRQKAAFCLAGLGDWNAPPESPFYLEPSLKLVQDSLAKESDAEAKCAMQGAVCSLEGRIANRGK
jgi:HEAT repeat protein